MSRERDAIGRPVPERLVIPFSRRRAFVDWCSRLTSLENDLVALLSLRVAAGVDRAVVRRAFDVLRYEVAENIPAYPCMCRQDEDCSLCNNQRWLTQRQDDEANVRRDLVSISPER